MDEADALGYLEAFHETVTMQPEDYSGFKAKTRWITVPD